MLATLKARLKELTGELDALVAKGDLTAADITSIETKTAEIEGVEKQIEVLEKAEATRARAARPASEPVEPEQRGAPAAPATQLKATEKIGIMVAAMAKSWLEEKSGGPRAVFKTMEDAGYGHVAKEFHAAHQVRALNSGSAAAGGVLVPENMANEIVDVLRNNATFLAGGPRIVPLIGGNYKLPAAASGATAGWRGEGQAVAKSQPTFKEINMSSKFVDALVPITNQLIRFSLPDVRAWVEMDMAQVMGIEIDRAAYVGEGTAHTPLGITKIAGVTSNPATSATPTVAQIESDAAAAELGMMQANLPMLGAKWVMSSRTFLYLQNLRGAGTDQRIYPELSAANPTWRNKPVLVTEQVPSDGGVTTDESEIWLVAFGHVLFGQGLGITFNVSTEATVVTNGTAVSAFQNDLTYIKASAEADVDMRYLQAVSKITGVRWGA